MSKWDSRPRLSDRAKLGFNLKSDFKKTGRALLGWTGQRPGPTQTDPPASVTITGLPALSGQSI